MPEHLGDIGGVSQPVTEKVILSAIDHSASDRPAIVGGIPKNVADAVADNDRGIMAKFINALFNYLRNRCL